MNWIGRITRPHGAVSLMVLAATLIVLMFAMVIFDAGTASRQKLHVQIAADTAVWSQSAVEARTMNMMSFANVGKRIAFGMGVFYQAVWLAWAEVAYIAAGVFSALAASCALTLFFTGTCGQMQAVIRAGRTYAEVLEIMLVESIDEIYFIADIAGEISDDLASFDAYQNYFATITPWWSWAEGTSRGARNGASSVGLYPLPRGAEIPSPPGFESLAIHSGVFDELPVEKVDTVAGMCKRMTFPDLAANAGNYLYENIINCRPCSREVIAQPGTRKLLHTAASGLASLQAPLLCVGSDLVFDLNAAYPWEVRTYDNISDWLMASSNLAFSYRAGTDFRANRHRIDFMGPDYVFGFNRGNARGALYTADGYFGMSRAEITFRGDRPDLWHASWSARMRPVALPDEWESQDVSLWRAFADVAPYMYAGALLDPRKETVEMTDFLRAGIAVGGYNPRIMDGITR